MRTFMMDRIAKISSLNPTLILMALMIAMLAACGGGGGGGSSGGSSDPVKPLCTCDAPGHATIVAFGDSTMVGAGGIVPFPRLLESSTGMNVSGQGVAGTTLWAMMSGQDGYHSTLQAELAKYPSATKVVENFGINDAYHGVDPEVMRTNLREFVRVVRASGREPVLVTSNPIFMGSAINARLAAIMQVVLDVGAESGVTVIDVYHHLQPTVTLADMADTAHPSNSLYLQIAQLYAGVL